MLLSPTDGILGTAEGARWDAQRVRFGLLGPLQVLTDDTDLAPAGPKVRQLLALLLTRAGRVVPVHSIVEELWDGHPPRSVRTTVQTHVYHLRRGIGSHGWPERVLGTRAPGYLLRVAPEQVDVHRFQQLVLSGRRLLGAGHPAEAGRHLRAALDLYSGPPLDDVECGPVLSAWVVNVTEQLREARHLRIEADIAAGADRELIGELRGLVAAHPLDEAIHGQLITVLGRSGRRSEAMTTYRGLRGRLVDELGVEPCTELQRQHLDLITGAADTRADHAA